MQSSGKYNLEGEMPGFGFRLSQALYFARGVNMTYRRSLIYIGIVGVALLVYDLYWVGLYQLIYLMTGIK